MKYNRIFSFGCSFTNYHWPTWANIIAKHLKLPLYNYAMQGCGNVAIMHRIIEANLSHAFNDDDLILILWSTWNREDRLIGNFWQAGGPVLNKNNLSYCDYFREHYWTIENDVVKNASSIIAVNQMFNINWQGHMIDYDEKFSYGDLTLKKKFKSLYNQIPRENFFNYSVDRKWDNLIEDDHCDIYTHAINANLILKQLNLEELDVSYYKNVLEDTITYLKENRIKSKADLKLLEKYFNHKYFVYPLYSRIKIK